MLEKRIKLLSIVAITVISISLISFYGGINIFADADSDGVPDSSDNCPNVSNPLQEDFDKDNLGDLCDLDDDNDKVLDTKDAFDKDPTEWSDFDSDGVGDNADLDDDNDGVVDAIDAFDNDPTEWSDFDFDGVGANQDPDDDNDGILDIEDSTPILSTEQLAKEYLVEIQDCALADSEKLRTSCYSQFFQNVIKQEESNSGPIELSVALSKLGAIDDCHFTTHAMAHTAFEENPDVTELLKDMDGTVCRGAFYHGSIASYFNAIKDNGKSDPISYMDLCDTFYGTSNYQDCIHGLGHGFAVFFSDDLMPAVQSCNQMSFYQNQLCIKGVMMQYTADQINQYGIGSGNLSNMCPKSELSNQDYQQCVMSIGTTVAFRSFHNFEVASKFCELIENEKDVEFCLLGLRLEIEDSEKYKTSPLTQEIREKFQPQWINSGSQIVDIRSPATISNFDYVPEIGLMTFSFDEPQYIILYVPEGILPPKAVVSVNGEIPNDLVYENNFMGEGVTMIRFVPDNAGMVMIAPFE